MNLRSFLPTLLVLASASVYAQSRQTVTYQHVATNVGTVLSDLSKITGKSFVAGKSLANDIVILAVKDMSVQLLMDKLAEITAGTWEESAGEFTLVRSSSRARAQEQTEFKARQKKVVDAIAALQPGAKKKDGGSGQMALSMTFGGFGGAPTTKAINRLLALADATSIAAIDVDGRLVFSTSPTAMQKSLPDSSFAILSDLVAEQNEAARKQAENQQTETPQMAEMRKAMEKMGMGGGGKITSTPTKALLIVSRQGFFGGFNIQLRLFDRQGAVVHNGSTMLSIGGDGLFDDAIFTSGEGGTSVAISTDGAIVDQVDPKAPKPATIGPKEDPIKFSEISKQLKELNGMNMQQKKMSSELRDRLLHPELYDPLSFSQSEALLAVADAKDLDVIAMLPDSVISMFSFGAAGGNETPSSHLKWLLENKRLKVVNDGKTLMVVPATPADNRRYTFNRKVLGEFLVACAKIETPGLELTASFALKSPSPSENRAMGFYLRIFTPGLVNGGMMGSNSWDMLRLYGAMSPDQRQGLLAGRTIPLANFSPEQRAQLSKMVFGANAKLDVATGRQNQKSDEFSWDSMMGGMFGGQAQTFREEPTEIMPNGIPGAGFLDVVVKKDYFVVVADENSQMADMMGGMGIDELAMLKYFQEDPKMSEVSGMIPRINNVKLGDRLTLDFNFTLAPRVTYHQKLTDDQIDKSKDAVSMSSLPSDMQARIDKRVEQMKKNPFPFAGFMGRQSAPPPQTTLLLK